MSSFLYMAAAVAYGAASYAYGLDAERVGGRRIRAGWCLALAAAAHVASIGGQCLVGDHPFKSVYLTLNFASLLAVVGYLALSRSGRLQALGIAFSVFGLIGLTVGAVFGGSGVERLPGDRPLVIAHVAFAAAGFAGFTLAAAVAGLYLLTEARLRGKRFRPGGPGMSLVGLDRLHHRLVLAVAPVMTLALATGILWTARAGGTALLASRAFEITAALVAWSSSLAVLIVRAVWGVQGRRSVWLTLVGLVAMIAVLAYYGARS